MDWYKREDIEKFKEKRSKLAKAIVKRISAAKVTGDEVALKKAYRDLFKFNKQEETYTKKADEAGYCW